MNCIFYRKVAFLFSLYVILHIAEACSRNLDCDCPNVLPYFDFQALKLETNNPATENNLKLTLIPDSLTYLVEQFSSEAGYLFNTSAWACSCPEEGFGGSKHSIVRLQITADQPFNDTLPAGEPLDDLFNFYIKGNDYVVPIDFYLPFRYGQPGAETVFSTSEKPKDLDKNYVFTISLFKDNGELIHAVSKPVSWK